MPTWEGASDHLSPEAKELEKAIRATHGPTGSLPSQGAMVSMLKLVPHFLEMVGERILRPEAELGGRVIILRVVMPSALDYLITWTSPRHLFRQHQLREWLLEDWDEQLAQQVVWVRVSLVPEPVTVSALSSWIFTASCRSADAVTDMLAPNALPSTRVLAAWRADSLGLAVALDARNSFKKIRLVIARLLEAKLSMMTIGGLQSVHMGVLAHSNEWNLRLFAQVCVCVCVCMCVHAPCTGSRAPLTRRHRLAADARTLFQKKNSTLAMTSSSSSYGTMRTYPVFGGTARNQTRRHTLLVLNYFDRQNTNSASPQPSISCVAIRCLRRTVGTRSLCACCGCLTQRPTRGSWGKGQQFPNTRVHIVTSTKMPFWPRCWIVCTLTRARACACSWGLAGNITCLVYHANTRCLCACSTFDTASTLTSVCSRACRLRTCPPARLSCYPSWRHRGRNCNRRCGLPKRGEFATRCSDRTLACG